MTFAYLIVEGAHDAAFLGKILKLAGLAQVKKYEDVNPYWKPLIPTSFPHKGDLLTRVPVPSFFQDRGYSIAVHVAVGDTRIPNALQESLTVLGPASLDAVAILLDADIAPPLDRFNKVKSAVSTHIPNWPTAPATIIPGPPRTGIFILPDNQSIGTLEDLLLESAAIAWSETLPLARNFVASAGATLSDVDRRELRKSAGVNKATVACIGSLLRPGKAIQASIEDNDWLALNAPRQQNLRTFLNQLIGLIADPPAIQ